MHSEKTRLKKCVMLKNPVVWTYIEFLSDLNAGGRVSSRLASGPAGFDAFFNRITRRSKPW